MRKASRSKYTEVTEIWFFFETDFHRYCARSETVCYAICDVCCCIDSFRPPLLFHVLVLHHCTRSFHECAVHSFRQTILLRRERGCSLMNYPIATALFHEPHVQIFCAVIRPNALNSSIGLTFHHGFVFEKIIKTLRFSSEKVYFDQS